MSEDRRRTGPPAPQEGPERGSEAEGAAPDLPTAENAPDRVIVVPTTGELIHLNADTTELAAARDNIDEAIGSWSTTRSILDEELTNRMDRANRRSAKVGPYTIEVNAPEKIEWDGGSLYRRLQRLVADGELEGSAVAETVERTTTYKVNAAAARRLLGHVNAKVREAAEYASHAKGQRRTVRVRRTLP